MTSAAFHSGSSNRIMARKTKFPQFNNSIIENIKDLLKFLFLLDYRTQFRAWGNNPCSKNSKPKRSKLQLFLRSLQVTGKNNQSVKRIISSKLN